MEKTLGGDRLGSGKRQKVELHNYSRSTHNLGYTWRSTMASGTLVPFMSNVALPGDDFEINLDANILTHPTLGPLFGSYKVQLDVFQCPMRLYQGQLHNNKLGIGMKMQNVKLPYVEFEAVQFTKDQLEASDIDNIQIEPSSIMSYLGVRGIGIRQGDSLDGIRKFNGLPLLSYWDIYKNYYANKMEENGLVVHTTVQDVTMDVDEILVDGTLLEFGNWGTVLQLRLDTVITINTLGQVVPANDIIIVMTNGEEYNLSTIGTTTVETAGQTIVVYNFNQFGELDAVYWKYREADSGAIGTINLTEFPLSNIDDMREEILGAASSNVAFDVFGTGLTPYTLIAQATGNFRSITQSQEGLGIKTYQSDLLNNWIKTDWIDGIDGITELTKIDTTSGGFTLDTLLLSRKVYDMLNRIAVSGGTYDDWIDAVYTEERYTRCESPVYHGGLIKELVFQEVISNSGVGGDVEQPLGTLAGRGKLSDKHKGGSVHIKVDEPSYIIGIVSLTPRIDYSQGNEWDVNLETMDDLHKPALDEIGFQELVTEQMAWWDTTQDGVGNWVQKSAGKQPAWVNYMTDINKVKGNFAKKDNEMFMTLNRRYSPEYLGNNNNPLVTIKDLTTYIDPTKFNNVFAVTSLDSQNFWVQIGVDIKARRKLSAKIMPNL